MVISRNVKLIDKKLEIAATLSSRDKKVRNQVEETRVHLKI